ncbi:MAG: DNA-directed RNA polymerase subunit alpha [Candidatus Ryanbacteria bacterium]|nr:DNA-directed RNA polymerase subunit alpha [Candidatus Ryanbacteria bacterium]
MQYSILAPAHPYVEQEDSNSADIIIEGLHPGYGVTLGNALRRVLFSSLPGAAVTRVKIEGVSHEFSTLPGVLEDILVILLNLKQLRFRVFSDGPETISFEAKGEGELKASDIKTPSQVEIINKNLHIATLTKKDARLSIELTVERGVGYRAKEDLEKERVESGTLILDAIFTPVRKISYSVENMRVGTETDYNRLIFHIETDGTIVPRDAFQKGLDILLGQLGELKSFREKGERYPDETASEVEAVESGSESDLSKTAIEDVKFSRHTLNALLRNSLKTMGELAQKSEKDLRLLDGIGDKAIQEIHRELGNFGLILRED